MPGECLVRVVQINALTSLLRLRCIAPRNEYNDLKCLDENLCRTYNLILSQSAGASNYHTLNDKYGIDIDIRVRI